jgi:hypothetical protein
MDFFGDFDCGEYEGGDFGDDDGGGFEHDDFEGDNESSDEDDSSDEDESSDDQGDASDGGGKSSDEEEDSNEEDNTDEDSTDDEANSREDEKDEQPYRQPHVDYRDVEGDWEGDGALEAIVKKALKGLKKKGEKKKKWCRLFEGVSFTNAGHLGHSNLPACTRSEDGTKATVPSMYVKDMKGIREYTQKVKTPKGTVFVRQVQLTARKFHTQPVNLGHLFSGWRATKINNRYFLYPTCGADESSAALAAVVNKDDDSEIVMPIALLEEQLIPFIRAVNRDQGYACCEIGRLGAVWFAVRNLLVLGHEDGHAPFQTSEKAKAILPGVGGKRYTAEFAMGRTVGTKNKSKMFDEYEADVMTESLEATDYVPKKWPTGAFPEIPNEPDLAVPCIGQTHTVLICGSVHRSERHATLLVPKPLHGISFQLHNRQTGCAGLEKVEHGPVLVNGYSTALSALGASFLDTSPPEYFRIERELQTFLKAKLKQQLKETSNMITLHCVKTPVSHSAGLKGRFPVFKATPVLRICHRWYNPFTLERFISNEDHTVPENLRYLDISVKERNASHRSGSKSGSQSYTVPAAVKMSDFGSSVLSDVTDSTVASTSFTSGSGQVEHTTKAKRAAFTNNSQAVRDSNVIGRTKTYLADGSCSETIEYSNGTTTTTIKHSKEARKTDATTNTDVRKPTLSGHVAHSTSSERSRSEDGRNTQKGDSLTARAFEKKQQALGHMGAASSNQQRTQRTPASSTSQMSRDPTVIGRTKTYHADGSYSETVEYSNGTTSTSTKHSKEAKNDAKTTNVYVRKPTPSGHVAHSALSACSRSEDGHSTQKGGILTAHAYEEEQSLSHSSFMCGSQLTQDPVGLVVQIPEVGEEDIVILPERTDLADVEYIRSPGAMGGIEEDIVVLPQRRELVDGESYRAPSRVLNEKVGDEDIFVLPEQRLRKSQRLPAKTHDCRTTPKHARGSPTGTTKAHHRHGSPASPDRVSAPIGMGLYDACPKVDKRVRSRTTKTSSDGLRVEVVEYTDGSKVTKTFAVSS